MSPHLKWGFMRSKDYCIPKHDVVLCRSSTDSCWWILLESFEVSHQTSSGCCSHGQRLNLNLTEIYLVIWHLRENDREMTEEHTFNYAMEILSTLECIAVYSFIWCWSDTFRSFLKYEQFEFEFKSFNHLSSQFHCNYYWPFHTIWSVLECSFQRWQ